MGRLVVLAFAAAALSGCLSTLDNAYDERARAECAEQTQPNARRECLDRVEQRRRGRD